MSELGGRRQMHSRAFTPAVNPVAFVEEPNPLGWAVIAVILLEHKNEMPGIWPSTFFFPFFWFSCEHLCLLHLLHWHTWGFAVFCTLTHFCGLHKLVLLCWIYGPWFSTNLLHLVAEIKTHFQVFFCACILGRTKSLLLCVFQKSLQSRKVMIS